jgi:hypothetical protein
MKTKAYKNKKKGDKWTNAMKVCSGLIYIDIK